MNDETFAAATMRRIRDLEAENAALRQQPRIVSMDIARPRRMPPRYDAKRRRFDLPLHLLRLDRRAA